MPSKKDYEEVAQRVRALALADSDREMVAASLAQYFCDSNSRFDEQRFMESCRSDGAARAVDPSTLTRVMIDYLLASYDDDDLPTLGAIMDVAREAALSTERAAEGASDE